MLELVVEGLALGCVWGLVAVGLIAIRRVGGGLNLAQGDLVVLGAFLGVTFAVTAGLPLIPAYLLALLSLSVAGVVLYWGVARHFSGKPLHFMIAVMGLGVALRGVIVGSWGDLPLTMPALVPAEAIELGSSSFSRQQAAIIITTGVVAGLVLLVAGLAARGKLPGIKAGSSPRIFGKGLSTAVFAASGGLAGLAGLMVAPTFFVTSEAGPLLLFKASVAVILAGVGSIPGAVIAALFLGLIEVFGAAFLSPAYRDAYAFVVLVAVLAVIPRGVFSPARRSEA